MSGDKRNNVQREIETILDSGDVNKLKEYAKKQMANPEQIKKFIEVSRDSSYQSYLLMRSKLVNDGDFNIFLCALELEYQAMVKDFSSFHHIIEEQFLEGSIESVQEIRKYSSLNNLSFNEDHFTLKKIYTNIIELIKNDIDGYLKLVDLIDPSIKNMTGMKYKLLLEYENGKYECLLLKKDELFIRNCIIHNGFAKHKENLFHLVDKETLVEKYLTGDELNSIFKQIWSKWAMMQMAGGLMISLAYQFELIKHFKE